MTVVPKNPDRIDSSQLFAVLKKYFGYDSFRPLQLEIINDLLEGRDVFALLPTGAGKSLCYQLPALILPGLTVVISPLIALMKDQVQALEACGVSATFLNSSVDAEEIQKRLRGLHEGNYRLLYVAPERLMVPGFLAILKKWKSNLIAIDESHCISEWGHDFRPEYRKLVELRETFPEVPIIALTATATPRVRTDIVNLLKLKDPAIYTASFNRSNLIYRVLPKNEPQVQIRDLVTLHKNESGIIYCQSRKTSELMAERLQMLGFKAVPYHAGLASEERSRNQDSFLEGDAHIVCATIAFGMGINKPDVRFVIHYDLPKNIEGYYQETGRSGRDGLSSDCVLLFSAGDAVKQSRFIEEKKDERERRTAKEQLQQMIQYAESSGCRRKFLLNYFGELFEIENCGNCDNCLSPPDRYDGTLPAQKFLSCIYRIRARSDFSVGMNHVIEVLTGADTEKIRRWNHQDLSTYGIGKEHSRKEWLEIGRELLRLGLTAQASGQFQVLELTEKGKSVLKQRHPVQLTRRSAVLEKKVKSSSTIESYDSSLFERLRHVRKTIADKRGVPAFIIFHDSVLYEIAKELPVTLKDFKRIKGVGQQKLQAFGETFISEVNEYLKNRKA